MVKNSQSEKRRKFSRRKAQNGREIERDTKNTDFFRLRRAKMCLFMVLKMLMVKFPTIAKSFKKTLLVGQEHALQVFFTVCVRIVTTEIDPGSAGRRI